MGIKIEIDLNELGLQEDPETGELMPGADLKDVIVQAVVARIQGQATKSILRMVEDEAQRTIDGIVKERVTAILSGPIQSTDYYGNPKGEPTSVELMTMNAVDRWLKPGDSRNNYSGNNRGTMGELIEGLVKKHAEALVKPIVEDSKQQITKDLVRQASEAAAAVLVAKVVRP